MIGILEGAFHYGKPAFQIRRHFDQKELTTVAQSTRILIFGFGCCMVLVLRFSAVSKANDCSRLVNLLWLRQNFDILEAVLRFLPLLWLPSSKWMQTRLSKPRLFSVFLLFDTSVESTILCNLQDGVISREEFMFGMMDRYANCARCATMPCRCRVQYQNLSTIGISGQQSRWPDFARGVFT